MKRGIFVSACILLASASVFAAGLKSDAAWVGVWHGELDGQPGVLLTLADDAGELGGTFVMNMVSREGGEPHVIASEPHLMGHPTLAGNSLTFKVTQNRDGRELNMKMMLTEDGKAEIQCLNCGADAPVAELQKEQYR